MHLFFGARYPCELYDLPTLWEIASTNPWLSVSPVSEYPADPPWAADYPDVQPPRACTSARAADCPRWSVATAAGVTGRS